jgi:hypothetical protein
MATLNIPVTFPGTFYPGQYQVSYVSLAGFFVARAHLLSGVTFPGVFKGHASFLAGVHFGGEWFLNAQHVETESSLNFGGVFKAVGTDLATGRYRR